MKCRNLEVFCESETAPIGIDVTPRFSWKPEEPSIKGMQAEYRIRVSKEEGDLVWDSGRLCQMTA